DKGTGRQQKITITANSGLSKSDVDRMVSEAELHSEEDKRKHEEIELKNNADSLAYSIEKTLREYGDKLPQELRIEVEGKISSLRLAIQSGDTYNIKRTMEELNQTAQKIGQSVYSHAGTAPGGDYNSNPHGNGIDKDSIDGEFREV
ncbi:MAG: Hsp70 family protein, partial [Chloroflexi bacterium]|nr:Hsp70 family protein [Chloroflexota bacterium]